MIDPDILTDAIVATLQSNDDLVAALPADFPDGRSSNIFAQYLDDALNTNFEQRIQEQPKGSIMVMWRGTRQARFNNNEATKHDFACYLKPIGRLSTLWVPFFNARCRLTNQQFRKSTIHPQCYPPNESLNMIPQTILIGAGQALYDIAPVTFTLTEKGLDI